MISWLRILWSQFFMHLYWAGARHHAPWLLAALAVTTGLHLWRGNALLSILGGTTVHGVLVITVFAH
ncbi:AzlD domain-containing protein [Streptomyces sp. ISL-100]|uniref:AzlD domain-containing protein n=1 Tax=Streptomyces sp. ISL-100 TaxID=2819173 RepID=UPI0035AB8D62